MGKNLVILESPGKVKAISKYLGKGYEVIASNGHLIDLPAKELGVDVENNFEPKYQLIRRLGQAGKIIKSIEEKAKKADKIIIATDPDREGEAIGWHLANRITKKYPKKEIVRVAFNEITQKGVKAGISNESKINMDLVDAQQARRIMDRLVGYQVSPFLWKIITSGLSAGRVQSVALKLICERDAEIAAFVPEEYWTIDSVYENKNAEKFSAKLLKINGKDPILKNKEDVDKILEELKKNQAFLANITKKQIKKSPAPPFITSTLLQESIKKFGFSSKRTMKIAQELYEGVELGEQGSQGLITYMRTDSVRVSEDAVTDLCSFINDTYGENYLSQTKRVFKSKKNSQDAHEAVRPVNISLVPAKIGNYLTKDQLKIYSLIWKRFVATQMKEAVYDQTNLDIEQGECLFRKSGRILSFDGYLKIYDVIENTEKNKLDIMPVYNKIGDELQIKECLPEQHFTKPPARYNEASLTKELEDKEIGRPSTYAAIIDRILAQNYVEKLEKKLQSTELGNTVNNILIKSFPEIINVNFTKKMENLLDEIAGGKLERVSALKEFYDPFKKELDEVMEKRKEIKKAAEEKTGEKCPECDSDLIFKWGRNGKFIACSNFPTCRYTSSLDGDIKEKKEKVIVGTCEKCGGNLIEKSGRYGKFIACDNYPKCKNILKEDLNIKCPEENCDGMLEEKKSKRGKKFWGCNKYPDCKFAMWNKPIEKECPNCGSSVMEEKVEYKTKETIITCPKCKYEIK